MYRADDVKYLCSTDFRQLSTRFPKKKNSTALLNTQPSQPFPILFLEWNLCGKCFRTCCKKWLAALILIWNLLVVLFWWPFLFKFDIGVTFHIITQKLWSNYTKWCLKWIYKILFRVNCGIPQKNASLRPLSSVSPLPILRPYNRRIFGPFTQIKIIHRIAHTQTHGMGYGNKWMRQKPCRVVSMLCALRRQLLHNNSWKPTPFMCCI